MVDSVLPPQGARVQSLVGKLRPEIGVCPHDGTVQPNKQTTDERTNKKTKRLNRDTGAATGR